jgi:hydroxyacylglutathione hydrolase
VYGGSDQIPALTKLVKDNDEFTVGDNIRVRYAHSLRLVSMSLSNFNRCLATPCHTQDSICYHVTDPTDKHPGGVFTGDTLFIGGCGRFFEGTAPEMDRALKYLATLPDETVVFNGHEYTKGNWAFGKSIEPDTEGMKKLEKLVKENPSTTGLTTIGDEKTWNVFMRLGSEVVRYVCSLPTTQRLVLTMWQEIIWRRYWGRR